jgi:hypothetical protein
MNKIVLLAGMSLLWLSASSASASVKLCVRVGTSYVDNNFGETWWLDDAARHLRGMRVTVRKGTQTLVNNQFLGDGLGSSDPGIGCTPTLSPSTDNGTYSIDVRTEAQVNNNNVNLFNHPSTTAFYSFTATYSHTAGAGTHNVTIVPPNADTVNAFNVFSAALYSVYRHNGGLSNQDFNIDYDNDNNLSNENSGGRVRINRNGSDNKFMITHELGHRLGRLAAALDGSGSYVTEQGFCLDENADESGNPLETNHSMRSMELQEAAVNEGFAHFFAADVWNDHDHDSCQFRYYKRIWVPGLPGSWVIPTVNCNAGTTNIPLAYMESVPCSDTAGMAGHGTEVDWMRTFWHLHRSNATSFVDIINFIRTAQDWNAAGKEECAYEYLDDRATAIGDPFDNLWEAASVANGVDHPQSGC